MVDKINFLKVWSIATHSDAQWNTVADVSNGDPGNYWDQQQVCRIITSPTAICNPLIQNAHSTPIPVLGFRRVLPEQDRIAFTLLIVALSRRRKHLKFSFSFSGLFLCFAPVPRRFFPSCVVRV
jgi:hypothetical protein